MIPELIPGTSFSVLDGSTRVFVGADVRKDGKKVGSKVLILGRNRGGKETTIGTAFVEQSTLDQWAKQVR